MEMGNYFDDAAGRNIATGFAADTFRPSISELFLEVLHRPESGALRTGLNIAQRDYVVQRATEIALLYPPLSLQPRMSRLEYGKQWMLGFLEWYTTAPAIGRSLTESHRLPVDDIIAGALIVAKKEYRQIAWTLDYMTRNTCLWWSQAVSAAQLDVIDGLWDRAVVDTWQDVDGDFGQIRMPQKVRYAGKHIELGWEIVHDWILPKDANHGVSMLTISHLLGEISKNKSVGAVMKTSVRPNTMGYRLNSGNKEHIIAIGNGTGTVVTCYRTT